MHVLSEKNTFCNVEFNIWFGSGVGKLFLTKSKGTSLADYARAVM